MPVLLHRADLASLDMVPVKAVLCYSDDFDAGGHDDGHQVTGLWVHDG